MTKREALEASIKHWQENVATLESNKGRVMRRAPLWGECKCGYCGNLATHDNLIVHAKTCVFREYENIR